MGALLVGLLLGVINIGGAGAAVNSELTYVVQNGPCTRVAAEIHDERQTSNEDIPGKGRTNTFSQYWDSGSNTQCSRGWGRPAGYITAQTELWRWNGAAWQVCTRTGIYRNPATATSRSIESNFGNPPSCGVGFYGVLGYGYVQNTASQMNGGAVWSGYEYLSGAN